MAAAAQAAAARGVYSMCGFSYRRTPALALARRMVAEGRLGRIRHVRAQYLQDWLTDPDAPLTWRLDKTKSGSGSLGDIGAHSIDAAQWITGRNITGVSALLETFVHRTAPGRGPRGPGRARRRRRRRAGRSPWTTPPSSPPASPRRRRWNRCRKRRRRIRCRADRGVRGHPLRPGPEERHAPGTERHRGLARLRLRGHELPVLLRRRRRPRRRIPQDPRHRTRTPLHRELVAHRPRPGLRTPLHPPGGRPHHTPSPSNRPPDTVLRRRPPGPESPRRHRNQRPQQQPLAHTSERKHHDTTHHPLHRPVGRPALRRGGAARRRVGLRRPGDRLLGRPPGPAARRRGRRLPPRPAGHPGQAPAQGPRDRQPPHRTGRLRRPDRRAPRGHSSRPTCGATATPKGSAPAPPRP